MKEGTVTVVTTRRRGPWSGLTGSWCMAQEILGALVRRRLMMGTGIDDERGYENENPKQRDESAGFRQKDPMPYIDDMLPKV